MTESDKDKETESDKGTQESEEELAWRDTPEPTDESVKNWLWLRRWRDTGQEP